MARAQFTEAPFPRKTKIGGIVPYTASSLQTIRRNSRPTSKHGLRQQQSIGTIAYASHVWRNVLTADQADAWNLLGTRHYSGTAVFQHW